MMALCSHFAFTWYSWNQLPWHSLLFAPLLALCAFSLLLLARVGCKQSEPSGVLIIDALVNDLNLSRSRRKKLVSLLNKTEILLTDRVWRSCVYLCLAYDDFDDGMKTIRWWFWELFFLFYFSVAFNFFSPLFSPWFFIMKIKEFKKKKFFI